MTPSDVLMRLPRQATARAGLACLGIVTIGFIAVCLVVLLQARRDATAAAETQAHNIAASVAQDVARNVDLYDLSLQAAVHGMQWPGIMSLDPALRQMILFERAAHAPYFGFINAIDANGTVIADSQHVPPRGGNFASRDYFIAQRQDARDVIFVGRPFLDPPSMIPISRRLSNPDGSFAGVVVGSMRLAYFRDLFARLNIGPHGTIALLRDDGLVLMRLPFNANEIGRMLPPDAPFFRAREGGAINGIDATDHLSRRFLFVRIGGLPLIVAVGLADIDVYAAWHRRAMTLGMAIAALSLIDFALLLVLLYALRRREAGLAALRAADAQRAALIEQRERAVATMEQTAAGKTRFVAAMSHELRTPLNSLLGYAELLALDGGLGPVQAGRLAAMRSAGEHLRSVIDKVLDFSRAEEAAPPAMLEPVDLSALVAECCGMSEPMAAAKGLRLARAVAPELPRLVLADAASLRQVLLNLLSNAVKFTERGEIVVQVTRCPAGLRVTVADTGVGIPSGLRDRLFQPYERLGAERMGVAGTGLGLAITARLVDRMRGRIGHQPNPAGGSIFWVELPLQPVDMGGEPVRPVAVPDSMRALRILVADDSALNRDVIAGFLHHAGHDVVPAENGEVASQLAAAEDFDVILMDLRMPVMDGLTALRQIRALAGRRGRTPVIAVTAQVMDDRGAELLAAGFQSLLVKPIDRVSLLAAIAAVTDAATGDAEPQCPLAAPPQPAAETSADGPAAAPDSDAVTEAHLAEFSDHVARLLRLLQSPGSAPDLPDLVHRIAGDSAQLGYVGLTLAARRYHASWTEQGVPRPEAVAMLRDMAETIAQTLNQRRARAR